jgi:hypothetical protein
MSGDNGPSKKGDDRSNGASKSFKDYLHDGVESVNTFLSAVHDTADSFRGPILKGIDTVESGSSVIATKAMFMYERRHEFGPHIVGGSAIAVGGLTAVRRGRVPGVLVGVMTGGLAYLAVYESVPLSDIPDVIFGKKG